MSSGGKPMSDEVKLIENWREKWEATGGYHVIAVADTPDGQKAWVVDSYGVLRTYGGILQTKPRPKTYRPWKREEVPVGSVVRELKSGYLFMITGSTAAYVFVNGSAFDRSRILAEYVQHRTTETGTWIPTEQCPKCGVEE